MNNFPLKPDATQLRENEIARRQSSEIMRNMLSDPRYHRPELWTGRAK